MNPDVVEALWKLGDANRRSLGIDESTFKVLAEIGSSITPDEYGEFLRLASQVVFRHGDYFAPPQFLLDAIHDLAPKNATNILDPWAGLGGVAATFGAWLFGTGGSGHVLAFSRNEHEVRLGEALGSGVDWQIGHPLLLMPDLRPEFDVVASVLPFGARNPPGLINLRDGGQVDVRDDLGGQILAASANLLNGDGVGIYVVPASFFYGPRSVIHHFDSLGLSLTAAFALPQSTLAPIANVVSYLAVVQREPTGKLFVGQLTVDETTNSQVLENFRKGVAGGTLDLGRFVERRTFTGLQALRVEDRLSETSRRLGFPSKRLDELATDFVLGRQVASFEFDRLDNSIYVPLIGSGEVKISPDDLDIKAQNYAQVRIDPARSNARFVAAFFNSDLGRELRELSKAGYIPRLNTSSVRALGVVVPELEVQREILELEAEIGTQRNIVRSLQNEIEQYRRDLWSNPVGMADVRHNVQRFAGRLSAGPKQEAAVGLDTWLETLPFPLASILRAWQQAESQDFKSKYEHLLHFFEGALAFASIVFLSAFSQNPSLFEGHRTKLLDALTKHNLSYERATVGTWKLVLEYLARQTRQLLSGDRAQQSLCAELFGDPSLSLPRVLADPDLGRLFQRTNKLRNDWQGHGGVVGVIEARQRNEELLEELEVFRGCMGDVWKGFDLVKPNHTVLTNGIYQNTVTLLMGSNNQFLNPVRTMSVALDAAYLYLLQRDQGTALRLVPLVRVGPSPESVPNAFYFFNRLERDSVRFVSYHFVGEPALTGLFEDTTRVVKALSLI